MRKIILAGALALVLPAAAQAAADPACSSGDVARVRLSKIKAGGSMAAFNEAVAAHRAWYKSHGYKITTNVAPVLSFKDGKEMVSPDEVMTFSTGDDVPKAKHDAAWDAFVAKYRAASDMESEKIVCMPK